MSKRPLIFFIAAGLACALSFAAAAPAQAALVTVLTDSVGVTVDVKGTLAGADITNFNTQLTEINGATLAPFNLPLSFTTVSIVDSGGVFSGSGTKTIGNVPGNEATLTFVITAGSVTLSGTHLDLIGTITGVSAPGTVVSGDGNTYDFSKMAPGGLISLSMSKTTANYNAVLNHPGVNALQSGFGLQQSVGVPEPGSLALLGIGMTGFLAFRRFFKKTAVA